MINDDRFVLDQHKLFAFYVLADWNNTPERDIYTETCQKYPVTMAALSNTNKCIRNSLSSGVKKCTNKTTKLIITYLLILRQVSFNPNNI